MKHRVIIALGSNQQQAVHIQWASECLLCLLDDCLLSRRLWTADIKGSGKWYMNRLVTGMTDLSADDLQALLKETEAATRRTKARVTIDLDLMQYDDCRYHEKDWQRPYIQNIIQDIL
ncbi:MAG: 2-amino-4-hydroxy-6-hydroxymethyldihydropteridine diphosphokinase [Paludibacteraceae bacterium]|nr:2-amino-4-hydroxy-6-hydroxymethyldihydropteridine diphosphokinase [Prevotella sp.]MBQ8152324.1 2-amino-4-hydroxy-6-hydroxymethyldihydropteridine diphosphokinase [Prevotella sp.]MBQ8705993.1 2-amino-4-hydroxy-6-hydroxymethyldihydropteridine diphosphokinase [Paludibacteraceae bacterium]MBQ8715134.1 2-amino-4-hydroxy-6-hydroxymethyldihydropteridine diphosphokinase [Prevotella sp.]